MTAESAANARIRHGVALLAAVATLMIVALLLAGGIAAVQATQSATRDQQWGAELLAADDEAVAHALADWTSLGLDSLATGQTSAFAARISNQQVTATVSVTATPNAIYWIVASATLVSAPDIHRIISLVAARSTDSIPPAAVSARGGAAIGAEALFTSQQAPGTPDSCSAGGASGDLWLGNGASLRVLPGGDTAGVVVSYALPRDSSAFWLPADELRAFDRASPASIPAGATIALDGDARVHGDGDLTISGGTGSGVVITEGRLVIAGPVTFTGLLLARGGVEFAPATGSAVTGAIVSAADVHVESVLLRYSSCAIATALERAFPPRPIASRAWAPLYASP